MTDLHFLTIAEASKLIAAKKLSPVELTEACLSRIDSLDDQLDSFVTLTVERARADAQAAEASIMAGGPASPMHGIPYCLKDIYDTAGIRTTGMSRLLADNVPTRDSLCEEKLAAAGGRLRARDHGHGYWWLHPRARRRLWHRGPETHLRSGQPPGRHSQLFQP